MTTPSGSTAFPVRLLVAVAAVAATVISALLGTGVTIVLGVPATWALAVAALAWTAGEAVTWFPDRVPPSVASASPWLGRIGRASLWAVLILTLLSPDYHLVGRLAAIVGSGLAEWFEIITIGIGVLIGLAIIAKIVATDMGHGRRFDRALSLPARAFLRLIRRATGRSRGWAPAIAQAAVTWTVTGRLEISRPATRSARIRPATTSPATADPMAEAVALALRDADLPPATFVLRSVDRAYDGATYHYAYAGPMDTAPAWRAAQGTWQGLKDSIEFYSANDKLTVAGDVSSHEFTIVAKLPPPGFPGGPGDTRTNLVRFLEINAGAMAAHPRRFCIGLDHEARPVWIDYRTAVHTLVCGVSGCGKTVSAVISPVLQLATINRPADLSLWVLDSTKRELTARLGSLPHVDRLVVADTGAAAVTMLEAFLGAMLDRQARYRGEEWSPATGDPWMLLVIEEWQALRLSLSKQELAEIESLMGRVAAIGRSAGCHISLATQKATAGDVLPSSISTNLPTKIAGHSRSADYAAILETQVSIAGKDKGRLAIKGIEESIVMVQGLFASPDEMAAIASSIVARHGRKAA